MGKKSQHYTTFEPPSRKWLVLLVLVLFIPAASSFFTNHKHRSAWEKRDLAQMPNLESVQDIASFFSKMDLYLNDHIGLALDSNRLYRKIIFYVFRESPIRNITYGKNGFVYLNAHSTKYLNSNFESTCIRGVDPKYLPGLTRKLDTIFKHFEQRNYQVSFAVPVTKIAIYPENLPDNTPANILKACAKYRLGNNNPVLLDTAYSGKHDFYYPLQALSSLKDNPHFYPKENFHWNGMSAHVFSMGLLARMGITVDESIYNERSISTVSADLTDLGFDRQIKAWFYPYSGYKIHRSTRSPSLVKQYYRNATDFAEFKTANPATEQTALVLSNSFGSFTVPHLAPAFKTLYHVNINHLAEDEGPVFYAQLIDSLNPDRIIFIFEDTSLIRETAISTILEYIK